MDETKLQALRAALDLHRSVLAEGTTLQAESAEAVVETARKFEAFLRANPSP